jgi:hypothetical protein
VLTYATIPLSTRSLVYLSGLLAAFAGAAGADKPSVQLSVRVAD